MPSDAFNEYSGVAGADELYEFVALIDQGDKQLCLTTIARWYHSFPSRTGQ